jgi:hypothetical protein
LAATLTNLTTGDETMHVTNYTNQAPARSRRGRLIVATAVLIAIAPLSVCVTSVGSRSHAKASLEEVYILRSVREQHESVADWCSSAKTGFAPFPSDAERFFSFWSVRSEAGKVVDAKAVRMAELRGCFGPTGEPARQNFYAEVKLGSISFRGQGECRALRVDFPEPGLFPVRCQLVLSGMAAPYVGGLLTTNTLTSKATFGPATDPPGYTQASIATIRLWRAR